MVEKTDSVDGSWLVIHPYRRIYWDIFVFAVIMASAFEIPYDWLVGWGESRLSLIFDGCFTLVFTADIALNMITMRERSFSGLWGWRELGGLLHGDWSTERNRRRYMESRSRKQVVLDRPTLIASDYVRSHWFVIDVLSSIPWSVFANTLSPLTSLRMLRLLRLGRLFRVLRLTKAVHLIERIRRAVPAIPSVERLISIAISLPWLAHFMACLTVYFEVRAGNDAMTYAHAFHAMWMAIIARQTLLGAVSTPTFLLMMVGVVLSVFVLASVTGNLAALYTSIDFGRRESAHVVLEDHTVIIGWNNNIFSVVEQFMEAANAEAGRLRDIVILSEKEEAAVLHEFDEYGLAFDPRRITVLTGSIHAVQNIRRLSIGRAGTVILLGGSHEEVASEDDAFRRADADVLKVLLACAAAFDKDEWERASRRRRNALCVVAAVHSRQAAATMKAGVPRTGGRDQPLDIHLVDTEDILARCIAKVASDTRFAELFREIFSYTYDSGGPGESTEIYVIEVGEIVGSSIVGSVFDDLVGAMPKAVPLGFYSSVLEVPEDLGWAYEDHVEEGARRLFLNPGWRSDATGQLVEVPFEREHRLQAGDALVVLARSRKDARMVSSRAQWEDAEWGVPQSAPARRAPRHVRVVGDGRKAGRVVNLLADHLPRGSRVNVPRELEPTASAREQMAKRSIQLHAASTESEQSAIRPSETSDVVVVLSSHGDRHRHDADILMSMTAVEAARRSTIRPACQHVIELLDAHNLELADAFGDVAALISPELVSNYLVQIANHPARGPVYLEILDILGNEFYIVPICRYLAEDEHHAGFSTIERRARQLGEIAVGLAMTVEGRSTLCLCPSSDRRGRAMSGFDDAHEVVEGVVVLAGCYPEPTSQ